MPPTCPPKRLQFTSGAGKATGAVNFSTIMLGRGEHVVQAMLNLAAKYGGATRVCDIAATRSPPAHPSTRSPESARMAAETANPAAVLGRSGDGVLEQIRTAL